MKEMQRKQDEVLRNALETMKVSRTIKFTCIKALRTL